jgi:hypothetical protein
VVAGKTVETITRQTEAIERMDYRIREIETTLKVRT